MGNTEGHNRIVEIAPGFYNVRASFRSYSGLVDIGTHMSLVKLSKGSFLVIDTVPLDKGLKAEIDALTDNGSRIEAVLAVHPFHSLAFPAFYKAYPHPQYIGTPRHFRTLKDIPWAGEINNPQILSRWNPDIHLRIPAAAEFKNPLPEKYNHFTSVWVYHKPSKTLHVDDTINYFDHPDALMKLAGKKSKTMEFHMSISGPGLFATPDAPKIFKKWVQDILEDWDFDNMCCAHIGNKIGGAKEALRETLVNSESIFKKLEKENAFKTPLETEEVVWIPTSEDEIAQCNNFNVNGTECG